MNLLENFRAKLAFSKIFYENGRKPTEIFQNVSENSKMFSEFYLTEEDNFRDGNNIIWHDENGKCLYEDDSKRGFNLVVIQPGPDEWIDRNKK